MEIIEDLTQKNRRYRFTHIGCCIFVADESEFKWTTGQYNETVADVICPKCGHQFYDEPKEVGNIFQTSWPKSSTCTRNCKNCPARCLFRKEKYYLSKK